MKLHLGCGSVHLNGWINIDRRYQPGVDRVDNIGLLQHVPKGSVEEIYVCHALDHFDRWSYPFVLRRWFYLLRPGGALRISTPDFGWAIAFYRGGGALEDLVGHLYASQDYPDNVRHFIWDWEMAERDLREAGFASVETYDPRPFMVAMGTEDCSLIQDAVGTYRSLNVLARKPL